MGMTHLTDEPGKITRITPARPEPHNPLFPVSWVFTFGLDHPLRRRYIRLTGDEEKARTLMTEIFGQGNWAGCYREDLASRVIDRGRLTQLDLGLT